MRRATLVAVSAMLLVVGLSPAAANENNDLTIGDYESYMHAHMASVNTGLWDGVIFHGSQGYNSAVYQVVRELIFESQQRLTFWADGQVLDGSKGVLVNIGFNAFCFPSSDGLVYEAQDGSVGDCTNRNAKADFDKTVLVQQINGEPLSDLAKVTVTPMLRDNHAWEWFGIPWETPVYRQHAGAYFEAGELLAAIGPGTHMYEFLVEYDGSVVLSFSKEFELTTGD